MSVDYRLGMDVGGTFTMEGIKGEIGAERPSARPSPHGVKPQTPASITPIAAE